MQRFWLLISLLIYFVIIILPHTATAQSERDTVQYTMADTVLANKLFREVKELFKEEKWKEAEEKGEIVKHIYLELFGEESEEVADILEQLGGIAHFQGKQDIAVKTIEKVLEIRSKILDPSDPEIVRCYHNLGYFFESEWQYEKAIQYYQTGLDICLKYLYPQHLGVAESYYKLGNVYNEKGDYTEAIKSYLEVLEIYSAHYSSESFEMGDLYESIGIAYENAGDPNKAIEFKEKSLDIRLKLFGTEHIDVATSYNNLGYSLNSIGNYEMAIQILNNALDIRLKLLGEKHLKVAGTLSNLFVSYYYKGDYEKALHYLEKELNIKTDILGKEHPDVARSLNNLGVIYDEKGDYGKAIEYYQRALNIRLSTLGKNHPVVAGSYQNLGTFFETLGEYDKALEYKQESLEIQLKVLGDQHPDVAQSYNNIGVNFDSKGEYDTAIEFYQKALEIRLKVLGDQHPDVAATYNNLGISYGDKGEYDKAIVHCQKALQIFLITSGETHPNVAVFCDNIGNQYTNKGEYDKAIEYHRKALQIFLENFGEEHPQVAGTYNNIGNAYNYTRENDKAIEYYQKALQIFLENFGEEHPQVAGTYNNIGNAYKYTHENDKAIEYYQKALQIYLKNFGEKHHRIATSNNNIGSVYFDKKQYDEAIKHYQKALESSGYNPNDYSKLKYFEKLIDGLKGISLSNRKGYLQSHNVELLNQGYNYVLKALDVIDFQISTLTEENSISFWQTQNYPVYEQAIDISLLKAEIDQDNNLYRTTFTYAEKSKASQLQAQLKAAEALTFAGIPDSLTQKEYDLRIDITWREKQRQALLDQGKSETDTTVLRISSIIFDLRQEYDSLKQRLEVDYPDYYRAKYDLSTVSVDYVQDSLLQPNQSLIEYFVGDSSLFIFLVQPNHYEVQEVKMDTSFQQWIRDMTQEGLYGHYSLPESMRSRANLANSKRRYAAAAAKLYQALIAPIQDKLTTEVIIVPDGALGYVPFEALLKSEPSDPSDFSTYEYLLQDHQISYSYSATLLKEMRDKQHRQQPSGKLLAFAPFFLGDADTLVVHVDTSDITYDLVLKDKLEALDESGLEIKTITKRLKGDPYYGANASIQRFQDLASQYRILHLSTHAKADDRVGDYAYLAFGFPDAKGEFAKLYARDLYNISLNADMVVLSACETGIGKLQRGEGIVSLARAFAYAGAKSIVTTLWKVEENATKDLVVSFYKYLKKGKTKDEALRLAKLEYIKDNAKDNEKLHPFFWASMIGIGDMSAIR